MITKIFRSKSDIVNLAKIRVVESPEEKDVDFHGKIVKKPWGYEYLMFENSDVAIWILYIKHKHSTSLHCHPNKRTSLIVLSGQILFSSLENYYKLRFLEGLNIEETVFHSSKSISKKGVLLMEIETPPNKKDLVRLKDEYGRAHTKYEAQFSPKVENYHHAHFNFGKNNSEKEKALGRCLFKMRHLKKSKSIQEKITSEKGQVFCLLSGSLHHDRKGELMAAGEIALLSDIRNMGNIYAPGNVSYLVISDGQQKNKTH